MMIQRLNKTKLVPRNLLVYFY